MSSRELGNLLGERRGTRARKVSDRMAVVDQRERRAAVAARLDALENDNAALDQGGDDSDEEFMMDVDDEGNEFESIGKKGRRSSVRATGGRKTRGKLADRAAKNFQNVLEEAGLENYSEPNYVSAAAGPSSIFAPRKFCSVCSCVAAYTCVRCGARYCSQKCFGTHSDTRCLKFMA